MSGGGPAAALAALLAVSGAAWDAGQPGALHLLVSGLRYELVWAAALQALAPRGLARVGESFIITDRVERPPRAGEEGFGRVAERVIVWVEPFGERLTRVTARVDREGWRDGAWVALPASEAAAREILAQIRDVPLGAAERR